MQLKQRGLATIFSVLLSGLATAASADNFPLPATNEALIGQAGYIHARQNDTPVTISQRYNLGVNAILDANPGTVINTVFPVDKAVRVPTEFLLPPLPRTGIIVNLPEMRLYYYPPGGGKVMTFPVGIGRIGKTIPIRRTAIVRKVVDPVWIPPADIRAFDEAQGLHVPRVMPAGPDNPLGPYAIYLRIPTYLIHSTIFPDSIGTRASFGCIRMNEGDIVQFFPLVTPGTPVDIINMPNKVAWNGDALYLEAHPPLAEHSEKPNATLGGIVNEIENQMPKDAVTLINWQMVAELAEQPDGLPHDVGMRLNSL